MLEMDGLAEDKDARIRDLEEEVTRLKRENSQWEEQCGRLESQVAALQAEVQANAQQQENAAEQDKGHEQLYLTETKFKHHPPPVVEETQIVTIDHDEKNDKSIEQKYHLMKKKLKKQKDISETQQTEIEDLRAQLDELQKETFIKIK